MVSYDFIQFPSDSIWHLSSAQAQTGLNAPVPWISRDWEILDPSLLQNDHAFDGFDEDSEYVDDDDDDYDVDDVVHDEDDVHHLHHPHHHPHDHYDHHHRTHAHTPLTAPSCARSLRRQWHRT